MAYNVTNWYLTKAVVKVTLNILKWMFKCYNRCLHNMKEWNLIWICINSCYRNISTDLASNQYVKNICWTCKRYRQRSSFFKTKKLIAITLAYTNYDKKHTFRLWICMNKINFSCFACNLRYYLCFIVHQWFCHKYHVHRTSKLVESTQNE